MHVEARRRGGGSIVERVVRPVGKVGCRQARASACDRRSSHRDQRVHRPRSGTCALQRDPTSEICGSIALTLAPTKDRSIGKRVDPPRALPASALTFSTFTVLSVTYRVRSENRTRTCRRRPRCSTRAPNRSTPAKNRRGVEACAGLDALDVVVELCTRFAGDEPRVRARDAGSQSGAIPRASQHDERRMTAYRGRAW